MAVAYTMPAGLPTCTEQAVPSPCVQPSGAYRHEGFYLRLAGELAYTAFSGSGQGRDVSMHGLTNGATLAIGGSVGEGVVLAGVLRVEQVRETFHGGPQPERTATAGLGALGALVDWFPKPTDGWHVGAIAAVGVITVTDSQVKDTGGASFAGSLLGGYDWWIGPEWSLGIMAVLSGATAATQKDSDGVNTGYKLNALSAGIASSFTLH